MGKLLLLHLETVLISVEELEIVCSEHAIGSGIYLSHLLELLGDVGQLESYLFRLGTLLITVEALETVCSKHAIDSGICLSHLLEIQGDVGHVQSYFVPFGDSANLGGIIGNGLLLTSHRL